jgi:chemotaxis protein CheX
MAAPKFSQSATVLPRTAWQAALSETAVEVFSMVVGVTVTLPKEIPPAQSQMTGVVGIAGEIRAIFSLRCSVPAATKIASLMLHIPPDDSRAQNGAGDAVGEICNIVAGYFKAKIGLGEKCSLSVPMIVIGENYSLHSAAGCERMEFPLLFEAEPIRIRLDIHR